MTSLLVPDARYAPHSDLKRQHHFLEELGLSAGRLLQRLVSSCSPQSVVRVRGTDLRISTKIQPPTPAHLEGTAGLGRICSRTG